MTPFSEKNQEKIFYFNVLIGGLSLYSLSQLCKYHIEAYKRKKAFLVAEKTKEYSPDVLLKKIKQRTNNLKDLSKVRCFKYTDSLHQEIKGRVFLNGIVDCENPLIRQIGDKEVKLICSIRYEENNHSLASYNESQREYKLRDFPENVVFEKVKQFRIKDSKENLTSVQVNVTQDFDFTKAIQLIEKKDTKLSVPLVQRIIGGGILILKMIVDLFCGKSSSLSKAIKGIKIGISEKQIGVKVDSISSVYGEVIYNLETGKLRFDLPYALSSDKSQFIQKLKEGLLESRFYRNFFGLIFGSTLLYFSFRYYKRAALAKEKKDQDTEDSVSQSDM